MEFNLTALLLDLPEFYDELNASSRIPYLEARLPRFGAVSPEVQWHVATQEEAWFAQEGLLQANTSTTFWAVVNSLATDLMTTEAEEPDRNVLGCADSILMGKWEFLLATLLASGTILILLSFLKTRKSRWKGKCWDRPAVVYPIDFITDTDRRWAYTAIFTLLAYRTMKLFNDTEYWSIDVHGLTFLKVFAKMINIMLVGLSFFPLLSCVGLRGHILANVFGLLYLIPWVLDAVMSGAMRYYRCINLGSEDNFVEAVTEAIAEVPQYIVFVILFVSYSMDLVINIKQLLNKKEQVDPIGRIPPERPKEEEIYFKYVRGMLHRKPRILPTTFLGKLKHRFTYNRIPGFKYSSRLSCTMVCAAFFVFYIATQLITGATKAMDKVIKEIENDDGGTQVVIMVYSLLTTKEFVDGGKMRRRVHDILILFKTSFIMGYCISAAIQVAFMIITTINYKNHLAKLRRGVHTFHNKKFLTSSPVSIVLSQLRYSGYQIAFMAYGFTITGALIITLVMLFGLLIVLPLMDNASSFVLELIKKQWPNIIVAVVIYFVQTLVTKFAFLQGRGKYLALNNRRVYHMFGFFMFIFNVVLGIFSCLKRIILSVIIGTLLISRLDRPLLMKGFENVDSGYNAYLGLLYVDHYHNNPVMRVFIQSLREAAEDARASAHEGPDSYQSQDTEKGRTAGGMKSRRSVNKSVRNKWWKFVTLINNPFLVLDEMSNRIRKDGGHIGVLPLMNDVEVVPNGTSVRLHVKEGTELIRTTKL